MKNKFLLTATLVAALTLATPLVANAAEAEGGSWKSNSVGWWYEYKDGKYVTNDFLTDKDGTTYYFDANGYMTTGWQYVEKKVEGGTLDPAWYYFDTHGRMFTGWHVIDGKWYWFEDNKDAWDYGAMAQGGTRYIEKDKKEQVFAPSGQWVSGWTYDYYKDPTTGGECWEWFYANSDGTPYDYNKEDDQKGGWLPYNGVWYYICDSRYDNYNKNPGDDRWYSDGQMATNRDLADSKAKPTESGTVKKYYVGYDGAMHYGWYQTGPNIGDWMYLNADGTRYGQRNYDKWCYDKSWLAYNGAWYEIEDGVMITNRWVNDTAEDSDVKWYVGADGRMVTGWYNTSSQSATGSSTSWVYCNANGSAYTGWVASGGKWYYIQDGIMAQNGMYRVPDQKEPQQGDYVKPDMDPDASKKASDKFQDAHNAWERAQNAAPWYIFDGTGAMVTGWYNEKETRGDQTKVDVWYYADADGKGHNGWLAYKGAWYYIQNGLMLTNQYTPDGYWVGMDGVWR